MKTDTAPDRCEPLQYCAHHAKCERGAVPARYVAGKRITIDASAMLVATGWCAMFVRKAERAEAVTC